MNLHGILPGSSRDRPRRGLAALVMAAATLSPSSGSLAGFVIITPNVSAGAGSSGSFDVLIANTNPPGGSSYTVGSDTLQLALTGTKGVTFTGVSIATVTSYLYLSSGTSQAGGGPFSFDAFPNTGFTASDSEFSPVNSFQRTILAGQSFGLAHVSYTVAANASPSTAGMIDVVVGATSLSDASGAAVPFTVMDGSFTVNSIVPEPPTILLTAAGVLVGSLGRRLARSGIVREPSETSGEPR